MTKKKFLVCGLGKVGCSVADTLDKMYFDVIGIDNNEQVVDSIRHNSDYHFMCYTANAQDPKFIEDLRSVTEFNIAVVAISDFFTRLLCTKIIKNYGLQEGRKIEVIAWAANKMEESMLWDLGARRFIRVEENLGKYLAYTASSDLVLDFNSLRLEETQGVDKVDVDTLDDAYAIMSVSVPTKFKGTTIADFTAEFINNGQKIIAHYVPKQATNSEPIFCDTPNFKERKLKAGDTLVILGAYDRLKKLILDTAE